MRLFDIFKVNEYKAQVEALRKENEDLQAKLDSLGFNEYTRAKAALDSMNSEIDSNTKTINSQREQIDALSEQHKKISEQLESQVKKLARIKELYKSVNYSIKTFHDPYSNADNFNDEATSVEEIEEFTPSVILKLHCMDIKSLKKAYRENDRQINRILALYSARYTTKANRAIYQLMVIALRSELQNILYGLKFEKLETAEAQVKEITAKYLKIAGDGNQSIAGTLTRFIGEIEYLFLNAVKIEYNYYVKKEQARQEQLAIKEQMRQEAEERKALAAERKKIEQEEAKYTSEIEKLKKQMQSAADTEIEKLQARILLLQTQLSDVTIKKNDIVNLQNGKAGNIYIISNLGSFGENMFKIGMTRRLNPQERIDELGSASVPFKFDVHSFIFSNDAIALESKLHSTLDEKRVNKVNRRKEFFYSTIDELESLVQSIDPTAEFNRTMVAEEFRQSQSTDTIYTDDYVDDFESEEE